MSFITKGFLLFNTLRYLKPGQIISRAALRFKRNRQFLDYTKTGIVYRECALWIKNLDDTPVFIERYNIKGLLDNNLTLLNETRHFDRWQFDDANHLWNFNVHYLEYLVPLYSMWKESGEEKYRVRINDILNRWYESGDREKDSNQSYTISLRVINLLIIAEAVDNKQKLYESIYAQYRYLIEHQEMHLLGNHYLENLKAIVVCSAVFSEEDIYKKYIKKLLKEIEEELTPDGLHFEFSLMYHKIVLEDLIRVAVVLKEIGKSEYDIVVRYITWMCTALFSLEDEVSRTPLFNDAGDNVSKPAKDLLRVCKELFGIVPEARESVAGYQILKSGRTKLIMDCGNLSPGYMPGHAHCDCLSFELFYDGKPVFVNSGTYQYQGEKRAYFRSTSAHNTVMINGHEQSELWGEHRAGRRISKICSKRSGNEVVGEYKNFLREKHIRKLRSEDRMLEVLDQTEGDGKSFLHMAPGLTYENGHIYGNGLNLSVQPISSEVTIVKTPYSHSFGYIEDIECLVFSWKKDKEMHGYRIQLEEE